MSLVDKLWKLLWARACALKPSATTKTHIQQFLNDTFSC